MTFDWIFIGIFLVSIVGFAVRCLGWKGLIPLDEKDAWIVDKEF